jgi:hypothetical protein
LVFLAGAHRTRIGQEGRLNGPGLLAFFELCPEQDCAKTGPDSSRLLQF